MQAEVKRPGMTPTKKGKGGKQKKKDTPEEDKYRKAALEVDTLKQHLALQRDVARQATTTAEALKQRLVDLEEELEEARGDKNAIYQEMVRQYQKLQSQTDIRIHRLEAETQNLREQLATCQENVRQSRIAKAKLLEEKEEALAEMQRKMDRMEADTEKILQASLDDVLSKLQAAKLGWEKEATVIHLEYKERLKEFGLNPLAI